MLQPLTHAVAFATGVGGITGGVDLVEVMEGVLVEILEANVGAMVREAVGQAEAMRVVAGDLVMVVRGLLDMVTEGVLVGNLVPNMEGTVVEVAAGEKAGTMHSRDTLPGHPVPPQVPEAEPPSAPPA